MDAKGYRDLIESYVNRKISASEFETIYLDAFFKKRPNPEHEIAFRIISEMLCDVDAYSPLWKSEDEDGTSRITEATFYKRATKALVKLNSFLELNENDTT